MSNSLRLECILDWEKDRFERICEKYGFKKIDDIEEVDEAIRYVQRNSSELTPKFSPKDRIGYHGEGIVVKLLKEYSNEYSGIAEVYWVPDPVDWKSNVAGKKKRYVDIIIELEEDGYEKYFPVEVKTRAMKGITNVGANSLNDWGIPEKFDNFYIDLYGEDWCKQILSGVLQPQTEVLVLLGRFNSPYSMNQYGFDNGREIVWLGPDQEIRLSSWRILAQLFIVHVPSIRGGGKKGRPSFESRFDKSTFNRHIDTILRCRK